MKISAHQTVIKEYKLTLSEQERADLAEFLLFVRGYYNDDDAAWCLLKNLQGAA